MMCVLQIGRRRDGEEFDGLSGMYIKEYNPRVDWDMKYTLIVCDDIKEAKLFIDEGEAYEYYRQVCPNCPKLMNGNPNRPLTMFTVQAIQIDIRER